MIRNNANIVLCSPNTFSAYFLAEGGNETAIVISFYLFGYFVIAIPDGRVHVANMGPTWVLSAPGGPMLAPWTLLLRIIIITVIITIITIIVFRKGQFGPLL